MSAGRQDDVASTARDGTKTSGVANDIKPGVPEAWPHGPRHHGRGSARHQRNRQGAQTRLSSAPQAGTARWRGPSVAVRGKADGAHRLFQGVNPVRHASVDTATRRSTARQGDIRRDREKRPASHENSQPAGRFRRWWQVMGSNQRRLSRRFYRPPCTDMTICLLTCEYVASGDLRGRL
jgi:hypothetical protein